MFSSRSRQRATGCAGVLLAAIILTLHVTGVPAFGQGILFKADETRVVENFNWLPYAFFSESFGLGFGVGAGYSGWPRPETTLLGAATLGTKGSYNLPWGPPI